MCEYEAVFCKNAKRVSKKTGDYNCKTPRRVNDRICVEWTGKCHLNPDQEQKKAWTLLRVPPNWASECGDFKLIKRKDFDFPGFRLCTGCEEACLKKIADKKEAKETEREERKKAQEDASNESSRPGTPFGAGFGLVRRITFGETAMQQTMAARLKRVLLLRRGQKGIADAGRRKRMVTDKEQPEV